MKIINFLLNTFLIFPLFLSLFYECSSNITAENNTRKLIAKKLIKTERLNDNLLIVRLGPDAVTAIHIKSGIIIIDAGISISLTKIYREIIENEFQCSNFL